SETRSGRPWTSKRAVDPARRDCRAQQLRFKPLADQIRDRHRSPTQQSILVFFPKTTKRESDFAEVPCVSRSRFIDQRRRHRNQRGEHSSDAREGVDEFRINTSIAL